MKHKENTLECPAINFYPASFNQWNLDFFKKKDIGNPFDFTPLEKAVDFNRRIPLENEVL